MDEILTILGRPPRPLADRFEEKWTPEPNTGCHLWTGTVTSNGYGNFAVSSYVQNYAHRVAYRAAYGAIPEGTEIDHKCGVRSCVNPAHLEAVTHQENTRRRSAKP